MPIDRAQFPCWQCEHPQAIEARGFLGSASDEDIAQQQSPGGHLLVCCHVTLAGVFFDSNQAHGRR
jgi:hypothetical protein